MRIAYVVTETYSTTHYNGILMQAKVWANAIEEKGHEVVRVNPWEPQEWEKYDLIHIFGPCEFLLNFSFELSKKNNRIVFSPIIDTLQSVKKYKLATFWGSNKLRLSSPNYMIRQSGKYIKHYLVRSRYEFDYVNKAYSVPAERISIVPLSFRLPASTDLPQKENFCLHVSKLTDGRKNVMRLIQAAIKYRFKLVLAGGISSDEEFKPFLAMINSSENITYLGRISDDELVDLYKRAKVFALPSINEGVGMVALDAALYGCEIVITKLGAPKEYYDGMAYSVDPYSIDEIGSSILEAMNLSKYQPALKEFVEEKYNVSQCTDDLLDVYRNIQ